MLWLAELPVSPCEVVKTLESLLPTQIWSEISCAAQAKSLDSIPSSRVGSWMARQSTAGTA